MPLQSKQLRVHLHAWGLINESIWGWHQLATLALLKLVSHEKDGALA